MIVSSCSVVKLLQVQRSAHVVLLRCSGDRLGVRGLASWPEREIVCESDSVVGGEVSGTQSRGGDGLEPSLLWVSTPQDCTLLVGI